MNLEELYLQAAITPSDINEHLPKLRELGSQCRQITEFGVRGGVSTVAWLASQPGQLICYDIRECPVVRELQTVAGKTQLLFVKADTANVVIEETDLLFIDTFHVASQLAKELENASMVRRWIVMHDTSTFGERGEDGTPGLRFAIEPFLQENPEWTVVYESRRNNGLTILERQKQ